MKILYQKSLILFFCFSFFQITLTAQPPSFGWVRTVNSEAAIDMVLDSNKAVVTVGYFYNTVDFDAGSGVANLTSNGNLDVFITKYTSNGNFIWAKSIGGSPDDYVEAIKKDKQGNLYLIGIYQSTIDFDPGPGIFNVSTAGGANTFILKLDKDANFLWVKTITCWGNTLDIDDTGNILIGGYFGGTVDFDPGSNIFNVTGNLANSQDMFIMKLDNFGNFSWAKQIRNLGGSQHQEFGLETDPSGNVFFAGNFTNSMDFDPSAASAPLTSSTSDNSFILKLNSQGDYQWAKQFVGTASNKAFGLEVDRQGNVFTTGEFSNTVDFDPGPSSYLITAPSLLRCAFISKLDGAGNFVYAKNFQSGESFGQALAIDSSNNLYISGGFHGTVDFDPGPGIYTIPSGDLFTVKLNPIGNFLWAAAYISISNGRFESIYSSIKVDPSNNVYFAGFFAGTVDFDPGAGSFPVSSNGLSNMYLHKLGPSPCNNSTKKIINAQVCNNYVLNGVTYNSSGQYYQLLTNTAGCDSIIQINLINTIVQTNLVQTSCGPLLRNGQILSNSGIYKDTIRLSNGCDSIIVLSLTVNNKPAPNLGKDTAICIGDTLRLTGGIFTSYLWNNGSNTSSIIVTQPGIYWVNVTAINGCTARDSLNIAIASKCLSCTDPKLIEKIYPTPLHNTLYVEIKPSICEFDIDVYNVLGQLIIKSLRLHSGTNTINMEKFSAATYFYKISNGNTILETGKILKQ
jgi:hypothetical protein